ncbi:MAG: hypothetical protein HOW73_46080 [Polyangiaceae bacterium]|nr:hypothetical protein [Polyangiaceae bacterium]
MHALKARVRNGRLVLDEPTSLPEGTEVVLVPANDEDDEMTDEERAELDAAILEGLDDVDAGRSVDAEAAIARLRARP